MANFTIPALGPNAAITVQSGTLNTSSTSLTLVGHVAPGYGYAFAENTVRHLSNFADSTSPRGTILTGQMWYDSGQKLMKYWNGTAWSAFIATGGGTGGGAIVTPDQGGLGIKPTAADANKYIQVNASGNGYKYVTINDLYTNLEQAGMSTNYLKSNASSAPTVNNAFDLGSSSRKFATIYATTFNGRATSASFADVAERYEASEPLVAGDVVEIGGVKEIQKATSVDSVYGVISTEPAFRMNEEAGDDVTHPFVALVGRLPCKVMGKVKKGNKIVLSSITGVGEVSTEDNKQYAFGIALQDKDTDDIGLVEIAIKRG